MSLDPSTGHSNHQSSSHGQQSSEPVPGNVSFEVVLKGRAENRALVERIQEIVSQPHIVEICGALMGQGSCFVEVEVRHSVREPRVSFAKAGHVSVTLSGRNLDAEGERKHLEKEIVSAGFVALACHVAQSSVRRGGMGAQDQDICRRVAHRCVELFSESNPGCAVAQLGESRTLVRDLLSVLLQEPVGKNSSKKSKQVPNPLREELRDRMKKLLVQLGGRVDCSTPDRAANAINSTMQCVAGVKVLNELLNEPTSSSAIITGAMARLFTALREQFARSLIACDHQRCDVVLGLCKDLHSEISRGGYHKALPTFLHAPLLDSTVKREGLSRRALSGEWFGDKGGKGLVPQVATVLDAATLAREIQNLHEVLLLNQQLHLELESAESDFIDHVVTLEVLAPRLAQTLLGIKRGDESADPSVFDELLVAALAMRRDLNGTGLWYHDVLLSGRDIPPPEQRNPEVYAHGRADVYLEAIRILNAWRKSDGESRADLVEDHQEFFGLFVSSCARTAVFTYENQCFMAMKGGNDEFIGGAGIIYDDLAAIEANLPFMMECIPNHSARPMVECALRESVNSVRAGLRTLAQMQMSDDVLLRSLRDAVPAPTTGLLSQSLREVHLQLHQRVEQYAQSLTQGAKDQLETLFLQDSALGLVEHSKRLLDVVRLDPVDPQNILLAQMVEAKIRSYIELIDAAYSDPINQVVSPVQSVSEAPSVAVATELEDVANLRLKDIERALQAVNFLVKELRLIREGIVSYRDLLLPPSAQYGESSAVISRAAVVELASLISEQMTSRLSRALKSEPALVRRAHQRLLQEVEQGTPEGRLEAQQALDGLAALRLPRSVIH